jgi:hypothetical protein
VWCARIARGDESGDDPAGPHDGEPHPHLE